MKNVILSEKQSELEVFMIVDSEESLRVIKMRSYRFTYLFFLILMIVTSTNCDQLINAPQTVLKDMFSAVGRGNYDEAKQYATDSLLNDYILGETLQGWCLLAEESQTITIKILNVDVEGDWSTIVFEMHIFGEGSAMKKVELVARLTKVKGNWKVNEIYSR